ncbi:FAD:protein FMN transferase, partial [Xanthomonas sacchari]|uniref:FAD:protein FMN transferase n=1 Tax=Xanthomonas sacchari TaxID=56458 RepID=UPI002256B98B
MGTRWSARLLPPQRSDLHALRGAIQAQLDLVVAQMSTWDAQSDLSRYNRADADTWHALPAAFDTVLRCALKVAHRSGGAFDPTIGAVVG